MKKLFTILLAVLVLGTCTTLDMSAKKRKHNAQKASSSVNLYSDNDTGNRGIFHYREVLSDGRQIHDFILGIDGCDAYCTPNCEAYYYDVYNDEVKYLQGYVKSKNTIELVSNGLNDDFKLTVTYQSRDKIKVKEGGNVSTFKKFVNVDGNTIINEEMVRNSLSKLP